MMEMEIEDDSRELQQGALLTMCSLGGSKVGGKGGWCLRLVV